MRAPAIDEHDVTVYLGDAAEVLAEQAAGSVQCIVTSPPYYALRDYGVDGQLGLESSPAEYVESLAAVFAEAKRVLADDGVLWLNIGDGYSTRSVVRDSSHQGGIFPERADEFPTLGRTWVGNREAGRVRMPQANDVPEKNLLGIPWRLAFALQDDGWILRNDNIWHKANGMPDPVKDRLSNRHEYLFLFAKSRRYYFDLDAIKVPTTGLRSGNTNANKQARSAILGGEFSGGRMAGGNPGSTLHDIHETRNPGDVWTFPVASFPGAHFAVMPPDLVKPCILAGCPEGGTVYDPFTGSGTTAMVARSLGRRFVGSELNPDYIDIIRGRIGPTPFDFAEVGAK